eukprot:g10578.t1
MSHPLGSCQGYSRTVLIPEGYKRKCLARAASRRSEKKRILTTRLARTRVVTRAEWEAAAAGSAFEEIILDHTI